MQISPEDFEKALFEKLLVDFPPPYYEVIHNHKIRGRFSESKRQIDVAIYHNLEKPKLIIVGEAKRYKNGINVKHIESFIGMFDDLGAELGIISPIYYNKSRSGFSKTAQKRINNENIILLPIFVEDALILNWKKTARIIYPYDWSYHDILAKGLFHLSRNEITLAIQGLENIMYEEWQCLVDYGLKNERKNAIKF